MSNNKNVLYIGPYEQSDSWGKAGRDFVNAISSNPDINIKIHPIRYSHIDRDLIDANLLQLEKNDIPKFDVVIQHVLPGDFFYDGSYNKNIGLTLIEPLDYLDSYDTINNINWMDEIWVQTNFEKQNLIKSGVSTSIKNIGYPIDTDKLNNNTTPLIMPKKIKDTFKFYYIGPYNEKQNLRDIIIAFNLAFGDNRDVSLVLKIENHDPPNFRKQIEKEISEIKKEMGRIELSANELIITEPLDQNQIISLHNTCDCYISTPYAESYADNLLTALALNNTPIINKNTSHIDFVNDKVGFSVKSYKCPITIKNRWISEDYDFYTAYQHWYKIDIYDLKNKMLLAYNEHMNKHNNMDLTSFDKNNFSYSTIGKKVWE